MGFNALKNNGNGSQGPDEQLIVESVYAAVMERRLMPKTRLSEPKLCAVFGVGRMRVRRALLLLASQGIVELRSNRGAHVACPTPREADEVFAARRLLEAGIVRELAAAPDDAALTRLRRHIESEDQARSHGDRSEIIRLSGDFHVELARAHGNSVLVRTVRELITRTSLIVALFGVNRSATCPKDEHARVLDAIEAADADTAEELVCSHLEHIRAGLDLNSRRPGEDDLAAILAPR
ncbi:GntR family transcriptional regulator [Hoeflea sp.]|uniref:GntR family transcriptional regulator n=1 Tax=Hoeflea sp. TaxID=1940281 RepID=UPI003B027D38